MNKERSLRVKASWHKLEPHAPRVAEHFYAHLFELDSWLEEYLGEDWRTGGGGWVNLINAIVENMDDPEALRELIQKQIEPNNAWGLREDDLHLISLALFASLEKELDGAFTPSVRHAWGELYSEVAQELLSAIRKTAA